VAERLAQVRAELKAGADAAAALQELAGRLDVVDRQLRGTSGLAALLSGANSADGKAERTAEGTAIGRLAAAAAPIDAQLTGIEEDLDSGRLTLEPSALEAVNAALVHLRDAWWAITRDRLGAAGDVLALAGPQVLSGNLSGWWAINVALASIDRLEVRGRDSAGIHVLVADHGLDLTAPALRLLIEARSEDPLFTSMALRTPGNELSFVYKAAAEIGELGDNVKALRAAVSSDPLLAAALASPGGRVTVVGHTRWASVGHISEANAHPLNSEELGRAAGPYVTAALNGDIDNHIELRLSDALQAPAEITTDAKVIPALVSRRLADGLDLDEAVRQTVNRFHGSTAIAVSSAAHPDQLHLALKGSGQSLNVGLAEDAFVVASEPYGLVEETSAYLRMDGEATQGQLIVLDRAGAGTLGGIRRMRYDGGPLPVDNGEVRVAEITTRDIDRRGFRHFLIKEVSEAPGSFRKTLRGKITASPGPDGRLKVALGPDVLPAEVTEALAGGRIRRVVVAGQGTAAVAGRAIAAAIAWALPHLPVIATLGTELSGFGLTDDMSDTLVVAVSQSGTTADTNRAVDLVRARRALVLAVVNRRNSDLVTKAHGTLYTSDGRDVEMSVASTKAFYSQVAAGWLLAMGLADAATTSPDAAKNAEPATSTNPADHDAMLRQLRALPDAMQQVLESRKAIADIAARVAPPRRYWTVVGNGPDAVAAAEVRIKLSELCYRSIACDSTEDKKHIDLSCEPLILVCAAGLTGPNADDVAKEVAIYRAHKAMPVVIAPAGESHRFAGDATSAGAVIEVPAAAPEVAFVLAAMVGHLFGYEAAVAIDDQAQPLRRAKAAVEAAVLDGSHLLTDLTVGTEVAEAVRPFWTGLRAGAYNGNLEASTAVRLAGLLNYVTGHVPIEAYETETGKVGSPGVVVDDLTEALAEAIDQLTRPVDAIKHQAKTVTVGTSRNEDALLAVPLVKETLAAGASADVLGYRALRTLASLDAAVEATVGFTRYSIDWPAPGSGGWATARVVGRGGIALGMESRTATDPRLRGTKNRAAEEREVTVAKGLGDGRTVILVPEVRSDTVTGLTLLHVRFADRLDPATARQVLSGYRGRYAAVRDAVTETEPAMDDGLLGEVPITELLTRPVHVLASQWRRR